MFKKLKSLFIIEDENEAKKQAASQVEKKQSKPAKPEIKINKPDFSKDNPPKGKVDEKFINRLLSAIEESNLEGFDYLEYKQSLQNLSKMEMDEGTKFQSALAMAKTMGATPTNLKASAEHYISILEKEESKFLDAFRNQMSRHIDDNNKQLNSLELSIQNKKKQIIQLEKEIEAESKALKERKASVDKNKAKVEATKDSFYYAYHIVAQQIKDDLEKMKKYL
ncbi:MAG: hypothetical protein KJO50_09375 [Bacteroidia bacterium]|nr:hypothetical protein [Bacteroidia bacterium]NNK90593.1 hypothetical protein [Saprospiraceae bacterium]